MELTQKEYWDKLWEKADYEPLRSNCYSNRRLIELFSLYLKKGMNIIEIGCANSQWLPFLKSYFAVEIAGIDYSEKGIEKLSNYLKKEGIKANLYCCDFREPPSDIKTNFDVLFSFGVVEHFADPSSEAIKHFSKYIKKGGLIITIIPNLASPFYGALQKMFSKRIYNKHKIIDKEMLEEIHKKYFKTLRCDYYGAFAPGLINCSDAKGIKYLLSLLVIKGASFSIAPFLNLLHIGNSNKIFSNFVIYVGVKV